VPQDVAVVGFDDLAAASLASPPLSTVAQDSKAAGVALVEALLDRIEGRAGELRLLPVTLKVRGSSLG
jgi:DNA-binding LacI/PurR family transcriptional regulator